MTAPVLAGMKARAEPRGPGFTPTFTLASRITLPHLSDSVRMRSANASGGLTMEKMKLGARNLSRKDGSSKMRCVCALSLAMISARRAFGCGQPVP